MARLSERRKSIRSTCLSRHGQREDDRVFITERSSRALTRCRPSNRTASIVAISPSRSSWARATRPESPVTATSARHSVAIPRTPLGRVRGNLALLGSLVERTLPLQPSQRVIRQDEDEERTDDRQTDLLEANVGTVGD